METLIENQVNSEELSLETILSEGLRVPFHTKYIVTKKGEVFLEEDGKVVRVNTYHSGYKRRYISCYFKSDKGLGFKGKNFFVHRLVAELFIPNKDNLEQVNHIDGDPRNNSKENLEWVSAKQNMKHAYDKGLAFQGESCPWAINSENFIRSICECIQKGFDNKQIRTTLGINISPKLLWKIRNKKQWVSVSKEYDF